MLEIAEQFYDRLLKIAVNNTIYTLSLSNSDQEQSRLNQKQSGQRFKELECNIAVYEQELYEKDTQIDQLQKELEIQNRNYSEESHTQTHE